MSDQPTTEELEREIFGLEKALEKAREGAPPRHETPEQKHLDRYIGELQHMAPNDARTILRSLCAYFDIALANSVAPR